MSEIFVYNNVYIVHVHVYTQMMDVMCIRYYLAGYVNIIRPLVARGLVISPSVSSYTHAHRHTHTHTFLPD